MDINHDYPTAKPENSAGSGACDHDSTLDFSFDFTHDDLLAFEDSPESQSLESEPILDISPIWTEVDKIEENTLLSNAARGRLEISLPEPSIDQRAEYLTIYSDVVERVDNTEIPLLYNVEFTDGRQEMLALADLSDYPNAEAALANLEYHSKPQHNTMNKSSRKRKYTPDNESGSEVHFPHIHQMQVDSEDNDGGPPSSSSSDDDGDIKVQKHLHERTRTLRTRPSRQPALTSTSINSSSANLLEDELAKDPQEATDEDDNFLPVISDLAKNKRRSKRPAPKSRKPQNRRQGMRQQQQQQSRRLSDDSDIEFEKPRRSARSNKHTADMGDDLLLDDDSFYVVDDKTPGATKVISIREVFQPVPSDSKFASTHMSSCHTCGGSKQRGQLIYCQGCSLTFHKNCIGYRSAREHRVTKVGDESFVLQCKYCIGVYQQKDKLSPDHSICQVCSGKGTACAAFSKKLTARQEEKIREENGGTDPVTLVSPELLNNPDLMLFRCTTCHRGWHVDHLPSVGSHSIGTDLKTERLKEYSVDWQCTQCSSVKHKMHRLVAWRPVKKNQSTDYHPRFEDFSEDKKEYLVKWDTKSYSYCSWVAGAWVFGTGTSAMRSSFMKRARTEDLLKLTKEEAIPKEFLTADIVFLVKLESSAPNGKTKADEIANISHVSKMLVKFQGLAYDDVVWDSPPSKDNPDIYKAFVEAYRIYVEGKYFHPEPYPKIRDRVRAFKKADFEGVDAQPAGLKRGKLMGYQVEGLNWLLENYHHGRSVVLADEMGLGKTVQVISLIVSLVQDQPNCWPFLVVVPNATCPNWRREFKQWTPDLRVVTYHGGKESQDLAYKYELFPNGPAEMKAHVVIMSYDSAQDPRTKALFNSVHWAGLVVDEGQRLKNDQNMLYLALRSMNIPFRLLLTGTPLQNNKRELFNLLQFIDNTQDAQKLDEEYEILDKESLPKLHEKIRPYFLRRTKAGVLKFLPPMAQIILPVTMTVLQAKLSKSIMAKNPQLIKSMFANGKLNKTERGSLNNILMQLRKCLCHPFVYSDAIEERHHDPKVIHRNLVEASAKLILLETMLPKLQERGHRVLIFSQFLHQLDIIEDFLSGLGYDFRRLDGQISSLEKQKRIDAFNAPDSPIFAFLLSTRAGGVGINLATADTVIILDPDFNPHQDIQALSRAHRIGQKHKVLCFQLVTKDSVEERIMQVGRKKMALDHALIESMDDDEIAGDDLESILKHGAQALFDEGYEKSAIHYDSASVEKLLDRSQVEQTKTNEEGSAEAQFSFARVWANDKSGFTDNLETVENEAPELINSSVWDRILAEREEEARREAEANKEILGRGGRRRMAINYKTNALEGAPLPGDVQADSSDSSDDFAAAASAEESDEEVPLKAGAIEGDIKGYIEAPIQGQPLPYPNKVQLNDDPPGNQKKKQKGKSGRPLGRPRTKDIATSNHSEVWSKAGNPKSRGQPTQDRMGHLTNGRKSAAPIVPTTVLPSNEIQSRPSIKPQFHKQYLNVNGVLRQHPGPLMNQYTYEQPHTSAFSPAPQYPQHSPPDIWPSRPNASTEAQLRLAIDQVQRSTSPKHVKHEQINVLLYRIRQVRMQGVHQKS